MYLFFDTETTGFYHKKKELWDSEQPGLVQLAAMLDDEDRNTIGEINVIVKSGVEISSGAMKAHGITEEKVEKDGIKLSTAIASFEELVLKAQKVIAHNIEFDINIMQVQYFRSNIPIIQLFTKERICTMKITTNILKIPGRFGYKWPRLDEAYKILVDEKGFEGAHDAMIDVKACREVFYKLLDQGKI